MGLAYSNVTVNLAEAARTLGGEVSNGQILSPGPGHSHRDRSLAVRFSADGFVVHSFAGDDPIVCRDYVRARLGLPTWAPRAGQAGAKTIRLAQPSLDERTRIDLAVDLYNRSGPPRGTWVERYFEGRGLELRDDDVFRFNPRTSWKDYDNQLIYVPAMIAPLRDIHSDQIVGVHRTRLVEKNGRIVRGERRMLGIAQNAVIKIDPDEMVEQGLIIGEGIETCLTHRQEHGLRPVWALGNAGAVKAFPVLGGLSGLTILGENDDANRKAAAECSWRYRAAGVDVIRIFPADESISDANDLLRRESP
jgi:putative DNA primase/helicase